MEKWRNEKTTAKEKCKVVKEKRVQKWREFRDQRKYVIEIRQEEQTMRNGGNQTNFEEAKKRLEKKLENRGEIV